MGYLVSIWEYGPNTCMDLIQSQRELIPDMFVKIRLALRPLWALLWGMLLIVVGADRVPEVLIAAVNRPTWSRLLGKHVS